jgi:aminoglycoside phosphotransferase family enzyme/predicted kinase
MGMVTTSASKISSEKLIAGLCRPAAYSHRVDGEIDVRETHISWVFLAGDFAYKVKKPVKTSFLDYSTLRQRHHFCQEELRLDRRYAPELYLDVVPITAADGSVHIGGTGQPVEYAVKMVRFPDEALLSIRLSQGTFSTAELWRLADSIASFHHNAAPLPDSMRWGSPELVREDAMANFADLAASDLGNQAETLAALKDWTEQFYADHQGLLAQRVANGFVRECHGDLHLANVIDWRGKMMPFDGVEFNDRFRWIDVLSDAAFLAMDLAARDHWELSRSFINGYLERTGDHASLPLLRWYLVFRALVRAKVDALKAQQGGADRPAALEKCHGHLQLAYQFTLPQQPCLWITHGFSGSGKTTGSEAIVRQRGAFRLRSDLERKRHFGMSPWDRPASDQTEKIYSTAATNATYGRLRRLARTILQGGDSVIVDATFLQRQQRDSFRELAESLGVSFAMLDFTADTATLRERITERLAAGSDASDADLGVLERQIQTDQPLGEDEQAQVTHWSSSSNAAENP